MRKHMLAAVAVLVVAVVAIPLTSTAFASGGKETKLEAHLRGWKEIPGPGDPDGKGHAKVRIDAKAGKVCFRASWDNIATPTLGHIHVGARDTFGPVVVDLLGGVSPDALEEDNDIRRCVHADSALLAQIAKHPGGYYVNLHNPRFPAGAIRGQLRLD
jgi:hypothetical protein